MRLVVAALVVVLLAVLGDAGAFMSHRWLVPNLYFPMIRALDRKATTARKVFGGLSRMFMLFGRRRRSLDINRGDMTPCDLDLSCQVLEAMDRNRVEKWIQERWGEVKPERGSQQQLDDTIQQLHQLHRQERPHVRRIRKTACRTIHRRCHLTAENDTNRKQ